MKRRVRLAAMLLLCMIFAACGQAKSDSQTTGGKNQSNAEGSTQEVTYEQISLNEAKQLMKDEEGYIILDVRTKEEFAEGHIPGAIYVPNETISDEMPEELPEKDQLILIYCRSGNRSKQASKKLAELGYTNIKEFGGIIDWDGEIEK